MVLHGTCVCVCVWSSTAWDSTMKVCKRGILPEPGDRKPLSTKV